MRYVDGFIIPISRRKLDAYRRIAQRAPRLARLKKGETVLFSWIVYKSRAHRDRVNAKVMKDPRIARMVEDPKSMPFDVMRMVYGGFNVLVDL